MIAAPPRPAQEAGRKTPGCMPTTASIRPNAAFPGQIAGAHGDFQRRQRVRRGIDGPEVAQGPGDAF